MVFESFIGEFKFWIFLSLVAGVGFGSDGERCRSDSESTVDSLNSRALDIVNNDINAVFSHRHFCFCIIVFRFRLLRHLNMEVRLAADRCSLHFIFEFRVGLSIDFSRIRSSDHRCSRVFFDGGFSPFWILLIFLHQFFWYENNAVALDICTFGTDFLLGQHSHVFDGGTAVERLVSDLFHPFRHIDGGEVRIAYERLIHEVGD